MKYGHEAAGKAVAIDVRFFTSQLQPSIANHPLARNERISRYVSAHEAVVTGPAHRHALIFSQLPLMGETSTGAKAPVNLDLRESNGSYRPISSAVSVNLPATASGEARFPEPQFGLSLGGRADAQATERGQELFYPNSQGVQAATDEVVRAAPMGLEVSWILRSRAAASTQNLRLDLAPGQRLSQPDSQGVIQVLSASGAAVAAISPPGATDAVGQQLRSTMTVVGDDVAIHVQTGGATAYPVLIDPTVSITNTAGASGNLTSNGWKTFIAGYPNEFTFKTASNYSYTYGPTNCASSCKGNYGEYYYPSLPGAFIYEEYVTGVFDIPYSGSEEASGIFGPTAGTFAAGTYRQTGQSSASGPTAFRYDGASESNNQVDYCAGTGSAGTSAGSCPVTGTSGVLANNTATAAVMALTGATGSSQPIVAADGVTLYQSDSIVPADSVTSYGSYTPGTWTNAFSSTVTVNGTSENSSGQPGLGYASTAMGTNTTSAFTNPLTPPVTACATAPCLGTATASFNYASSQFPEGIDPVCVQGESYAGTLGNNDCWNVDIDRTPPLAPSVSGLPEGATVDGLNPTALTISSSDPPAPGANASSGVASVAISVDSGTPTSVICTSSCSWNLPAGLAEGEHLLEVTATDGAGNVSSPTYVDFEVQPDPGPCLGVLGDPGNCAFISLAPGVNVNVVDGDLSYTATDIAPSASNGGISLTRSYNSEAPAANLVSSLLTGGPLGPGWSFDEGPQETLTTSSSGAITVTGPTGWSITFTPAGGSTFRNPSFPLMSLTQTPTGYQLVDGSQNTTISFNTQGQMISSTDSSGNVDAVTDTTTLEGSVLSSFGRAGGTPATVSYNLLGMASGVADGAGDNQSYSYTPTTNGQLLASSNGTLGDESYGYNASGQLDSITFADGSVISLTEDSTGRVLTIQMTSGGQVQLNASLDYSEPGQTTATVSDGSSAVYTYSANGTLTGEQPTSTPDPTQEPAGSGQILSTSCPTTEGWTATATCGSSGSASMAQNAEAQSQVAQAQTTSQFKNDAGCAAHGYYTEPPQETPVDQYQCLALATYTQGVYVPERRGFYEPATEYESDYGSGWLKMDIKHHLKIQPVLDIITDYSYAPDLSKRSPESVGWRAYYMKNGQIIETVEVFANLQKTASPPDKMPIGVYNGFCYKGTENGTPQRFCPSWISSGPRAL